jgi:hypothetical protein
MIKKLHKMGVRSSTMYLAGALSVTLSVGSWILSRRYEPASLERADHWGIFVGEWAPTFFALGVALRIEEVHEALMGERIERAQPVGMEPTPAPAGMMGH